MITGLIIGSIIAIFCLLTGMGIGANVLAKPRQQTALATGMGKCGCDHNKAFHDPKTGECHGTMKNPSYSSDYYVSKSNPKMVQCSCKQYAPEDGGIEEIYHALASAPPIVPREIE